MCRLGQLYSAANLFDHGLALGLSIIHVNSAVLYEIGANEDTNKIIPIDWLKPYYPPLEPNNSSSPRKSPKENRANDWQTPVIECPNDGQDQSTPGIRPCGPAPEAPTDSELNKPD